MRDGNQALVRPLSPDDKLAFFKLLVKLGFKEIEIGYPSSSNTEFEFVRTLIEGNHIPDDVYIQVLTQAKESLIERTFEAVEGAKNVILHFYNNLSPLHMEVVFETDLEGVSALAVGNEYGVGLLLESTPSAIDKPVPTFTPPSVSALATGKTYNSP